MGAVRVLVDEVPPMLRSIIVDALAGLQDVEILAADSTNPGRDTGHVDVVLTGADDPHNADFAARLLHAWPKSRILLVASSGRQAVMYALLPRKMVLGDVSPSALARAIRQGFGVQATWHP